MTYLLKYVELRDSTNPSSDWSIRQIGIYHRNHAAMRQNVWFLFFPSTESSAQRDLLHELESACDDPNAHNHPLSFHVHLLQVRLQNWRLCISHFEHQVWESVRRNTLVKTIVMADSAKANLALSIDIERHLRFQEGYKDLSDLHYVETRIAPLPPIFRAQQQLIDQLELLNNNFLKQGQVSGEDAATMQVLLGNLRRRIETYSANTEFVLEKIRGTTQLVGTDG